jgi:hypothetical protein
MKNRIPLNTRITFLLLLGMIPSINSWPWAKLTIALWGFLIVLHIFKTLPAVCKTYSIFLFITCAATVWGLLHILFPILPWWGLAFLWIGLVAYTLYQSWGSQQAAFTLHTSNWPSRPLAAWLTIAPVAVIMLTHAVLNHFLSRPFELAWWTSTTWALLAITLFYPVHIENPRTDLTAKKLILLLFHIIILLHVHNKYYVRIVNQVYLNPAEATRKAFHFGYQEIGVTSAVLQANTLYYEDWTQAVTCLRRYFHHDHFVHFARELRQQPHSAHNQFFFTVTFGNDLLLQPGEEAIDLDSRTTHRELFVLTNQRLLRLGESGLTTLWIFDHPPVAAAVAANQENLGILLQTNQILIHNPRQTYPILYLLNDEHWRDLQLSPDGDTIYALAGNGRVESHSFSTHSNLWIYNETQSRLPLWNDNTSARSLLFSPDDQALLLLDKYGGVQFLGADIQSETFSTKDLTTYYNPLAPEMQSLAFWDNRRQLLLANDYGRIHILDPLRSGLVAPVKANLFFNKFESHWDYDTTIVAIDPIPEINTILELNRNGSISTIVMPQRYRIKHKNKIFRLPTN